MNFSIKQISPEETIQIRQPILRSGKPIDTCIFEGDHLKTTFHFGVFSEEMLLGVCSFFKNNHPDFCERQQYQLRGMAVLKSFQSHGLGHAILKHSQQILKLKNIHFIWCNAREVATGFYLKNGFEISGNPFMIKGIGTHYLMYKGI